MKPSLGTPIYLLAVLFRPGIFLRCERCKSATSSCLGPLETCKDTESACLTLTVETRKDKMRKIVTYKGCTKLTYCPPGPFTVTTGLGERIRSNSECCCWDHCNKGSLRLPLRGEPNHRRCASHTSKFSTCAVPKKLYCHGQEVHCFYLAGYVVDGGKNESFVKEGCGTKHTCNEKLGIFGIPGLFLETLTKAVCSQAQKTYF